MNKDEAMTNEEFLQALEYLRQQVLLIKEMVYQLRRNSHDHPILSESSSSVDPPATVKMAIPARFLNGPALRKGE